MPKILSEKKKAPVSGKKSKTDQVQLQLQMTTLQNL
jgi:hypothetical protein